jgi:BON domain
MLSGSVDSRQARHRAEDIAEQASDVSYVQNNIRVRSGGSRDTITDAGAAGTGPAARAIGQRLLRGDAG